MGRVKEHLQKHKKVYIGVAIGSGIFLAGITVLIVRRETFNHHGIDVKSSLQPSIDVKSSTGGNIFVFGDNHASITQTIKTKHSPIGNTGYLTRNLETGLEFETQGEAARHFGIPKDAMTKHLNAGKNLTSGLHFERISS